MNAQRKARDLQARYQALREKLSAMYAEDQYGTHARVIAFHDRLIRKFPDARNFQLFHLISGSTPKETYTEFDFFGPDSVEAFIDRDGTAE